MGIERRTFDGLKDERRNGERGNLPGLTHTV